VGRGVKRVWIAGCLRTGRLCEGPLPRAQHRATPPVARVARLYDAEPHAVAVELTLLAQAIPAQMKSFSCRL